MSGFLLCSGVAVPKARTSASAGDTNKLGDTDSDFPPPAIASLPTAPLRKASLRVLPDSGISGLSILWGQPGSTLWSCRGLRGFLQGGKERRQVPEAELAGGRGLHSSSLHGACSCILKSAFSVGYTSGRFSSRPPVTPNLCSSS